MIDDSQRPGTDASRPSETTESGSTFGKIARFVALHPIGIAQAVFVALIFIIILQNIEPTSFNVLFWSIPTFPKLVLIFVSMLVGAAIWELGRRWYSR